MCKAHLYTSPFKAKADNCAGDKLINLENEKQSLGGPDRKETRQRHGTNQVNRFTRLGFPLKGVNKKKRNKGVKVLKETEVLRR